MTKLQVLLLLLKFLIKFYVKDRKLRVKVQVQKDCLHHTAILPTADVQRSFYYIHF